MHVFNQTIIVVFAWNVKVYIGFFLQLPSVEAGDAYDFRADFFGVFDGFCDVFRVAAA